MENITFDQWFFLQPEIYKKVRGNNLEVAKEDYKTDSEFYKNTLKQSYGDFNRFEALTITGEDIYYVRNGIEETGQIFVESITKKFSAKCFYDWYSGKEAKIFKKLNKPIFNFMNRELDRL